MKSGLNFISAALFFGMGLVQGASQYVGQSTVDTLQDRIASVRQNIDHVTDVIRTMRAKVTELEDSNIDVQEELDIMLGDIRKMRAEYRQGGRKRKQFCMIQNYDDKVSPEDIESIGFWKNKIKQNNHEINTLQKKQIPTFLRTRDRLVARLDDLHLQLGNAAARELESVRFEIEMRNRNKEAMCHDKVLQLCLARLKRRERRLEELVLVARENESLDASSESEDNSSQGAADDNPMTHAFN